MFVHSTVCFRKHYIFGRYSVAKTFRVFSNVKSAAPSTEIKKTGAFISQLPEIYPADVYFKKALKKTREIKIDSTMKNIRNANRKHAAQVMDGLMKALTMPITNLLGIYKKQMKELHPYEVYNHL